MLLRNSEQNGRFIYDSTTGEHRSMSWLQSSLGFAKTAISQAQKSIDKVLDIKEDHDVLSAGNSHTITRVLENLCL